MPPPLDRHGNPVSPGDLVWLSEADLHIYVVAVCDVGVFVDLDGPHQPRLLRSSDRCFAVVYDETLAVADPPPTTST